MWVTSQEALSQEDSHIRQRKQHKTARITVTQWADLPAATTGYHAFGGINNKIKAVRNVNFLTALKKLNALSFNFNLSLKFFILQDISLFNRQKSLMLTQKRH